MSSAEDPVAPEEAVTDALRAIQERMRAAAIRAHRSFDDVRLLAVTKTLPLSAIESALRAGHRCFGESRVQEAETKILATRARVPDVEWHMIGPLQRNKAKRAVQLFDVIQSLDRAPLARVLAEAAAARGQTLRVLLQVNIDEEPQKAGVSPLEAPRLLREVAGLPSLRIEGLMAIPRRTPDPEDMRPAFARLRQLAGELRTGAPEHAPLRELSMGMSADFEVAIEEGATWVRIGTALFGRRTPA